MVTGEVGQHRDSLVRNTALHGVQLQGLCQHGVDVISLNIPGITTDMNTKLHHINVLLCRKQFSPCHS